VGPWIETELDPTSVRITTVVNSELRQEDNTSTMLFDAFYLVSHISAAMTLEPGDVIATGTPSGVGSVQDGDQVSVAIEGIGVLTNPVGLESP
jgi:2-keto-4-pentenoate hydratase/2-oxohepta-3-ene-1,7-dioic acid hydratase in catechol pathway